MFQRADSAAAVPPCQAQTRRHTLQTAVDCSSVGLRRPPRHLRAMQSPEKAAAAAGRGDPTLRRGRGRRGADCHASHAFHVALFINQRESQREREGERPCRSSPRAALPHNNHTELRTPRERRSSSTHRHAHIEPYTVSYIKQERKAHSSNASVCFLLFSHFTKKSNSARTHTPNPQALPKDAEPHDGAEQSRRRARSHEQTSHQIGHRFGAFTAPQRFEATRGAAHESDQAGMFVQIRA